MNLTQLQTLVEKQGIDLNYFDCGTDGLALYTGAFHIAIQPNLSPIREKTVLSEEYAHCVKGALYPLSSLANPLKKANVSKCERIAREYGASVLVPLESLKTLLGEELYRIAEYFDVEQTVVETAINYYRRKGLIA